MDWMAVYLCISLVKKKMNRVINYMQVPLYFLHDLP